MHLSISNIGWDSQYDEMMYNEIRAKGYQGIEIAPTRIIPENPYDNLNQIVEWKKEMKEKEIVISSMQSIWYGRKENIFSTSAERDILIEYTKKAILFAEAIECHNLVFGCPRNRCIPMGINDDLAISFFHQLGEFAFEHNTVLSIEPNPPIYNTNYINSTKEAVELIEKVNSKGFMLNVDFGTILENEENVSNIKNYVQFINHVHISEPNLTLIQHRKSHAELAMILKKNDYHGFVSIEMGKTVGFSQILDVMDYVKEVFA